MIEGISPEEQARLEEMVRRELQGDKEKRDRYRKAGRGSSTDRVPSTSRVDVVRKLRQERVKQYLLQGLSYKEIAALEGTKKHVIERDANTLYRAGIMKQEEEATQMAYLKYLEELEWVIQEAKRMHTTEVGATEEGVDVGGRIDCLRLVADKHKELLEMAQKLGLLSTAVEKNEHVHKIQLDDSELIKEFGDFIATRKD